MLWQSGGISGAGSGSSAGSSGSGHSYHSFFITLDAMFVCGRKTKLTE